MGLVRHDQVAGGGAGKRVGCVLAMAEQALLRGLPGMTALGEHGTMTGQTPTDLDLVEVGCPSTVFAMTRGTRLINPCMIFAENNGGMTGNTAVGRRTRPGS